MKIKFKKDSQDVITVASIENRKENEFSYINMIKYMINGNKLKSPEIDGDFGEKEIESINRMVALLNEEVKGFKKLKGSN